MFGFIASLVGDAIAPLIDQVSETSARLLRKVALFLVAALCMVVVSIALTIAFFLWLATIASPVVAALSVAGFYLTIAIIAVLFALYGGRPKKTVGDKTKPDEKRDAAKAEEARVAAGLNAQIDQATAPLMDLLARFGLRREQLAVLAGASVAKKLGPLPLVGLAIVGGFLIGRMWKSWRGLLTTDVVATLMASGLFGAKPPETDEAEDKDEA